MRNMDKPQILYCQYCGKECKNLNSLRQHEIRCKQNPNRLNLEGHSKGHKGYNQYTKALELGLEKPKVSDKVIQCCRNLNKGYIPQEQRNKISKSRKKYLNEHPDKVPFKLNHSSKISYPEQYFIELFENENIPLKYHKQVHRYELDFYNEDLMKYVEIDGNQHYLDWMIEHDKIRDEYLKSLGWNGIRISWSQYQSSNDLEKKQIINKIKTFLL